jgi:5-hydroxyisourate hydrolase-like protein (transthyretin family)
MCSSAMVSSVITVEEGSHKFTRRLVRLSVEQPMRGIEAAEAEVATGWGGGDCGYPFKRGERYVVYADRDEKDGRLYTGICTRTRPLAEAEEDFAFVRALGAAEPAGTVFGQVFKRNYEWKEGEPWHKPVADVEVRVGGGGDAGGESKTDARELKTDAQGRFRAEGLAPGKYKVTMKVPPGLIWGGGEGEDKPTLVHEVEVAARGCAQSDFHLESDTRIAGRVLDPLGRPLANLPVQLRGALSDTRNLNQFYYEKTDAEGRFEFRAVVPGAYLLGVRILSTRGENVPYPRTYFPGTAARESAGVVQVKEGEHRGGLELRMPPPLAEYEVTGTVVYEDGRPAPGATVYLDQMEEGRTGDSRNVQADERGRFTLKAYEGLNYKMSAYPKGATGPAAQSQWIDVPPPGARPAKLVLPVFKK